jgi:Na+/H+ antiporter NhaC
MRTLGTTSHRHSRRMLFALAGCVLLIAALGAAAEPNQPNDTAVAAAPVESAPPVESATPPAQAAEGSASETVAKQPASAAKQTRSKTPGETYGYWVFLPPLFTIFLAIALRQVIPAMFIGIVIAAYMAVYPAATGISDFLVKGASLVVDDYFIGTITSRGNATVVTFSFLIAGMSGIIVANGGTAAAVNKVARWASSRARGQLTTWFAGLLVFFDDYSNAMIIGPTMRPVTDRLKISREKLAYIVDSTAAPIASIALIGSWIGVELRAIEDGLAHLAESGGSELVTMSAYQIFLASIPYRFYPILALVMVALVAITNRDFGPMKKAEREAAGRTVDSDDAAPVVHPRGRSWLAVIPILVLIGCTFGMLVATGLSGLENVSADANFWNEKLPAIAQATQSSRSILYGAFASVIAAMLVTLLGRALSFAQTTKVLMDSMAHIMPTIAVLISAWAIGSSMKALEIGPVAKDMLIAADFPVVWLPLAIFVTACIVSFSTGTSYGTMGLLCPSAVVIAAGLLDDVDQAQALPLFYGSVGAVLAGAVFGDHCSPISDTTVLSSVASDCPLERHVWTQIPYALVTAFAGMLCGDVLCHVYGWPVWSGLGCGAVLLLLWLLVVGRVPRPLPEPAEATSVVR